MDKDGPVRYTEEKSGSDTEERYGKDGNAMGYRIITDSTTDLTQEMIDELELTVISLRFTIDGKTYRDKADQSEMPTKTFYAKLRDGKMSTTTQINVE